jgi:alpha-galactosidase
MLRALVPSTLVLLACSHPTTSPTSPTSKTSNAKASVPAPQPLALTPPMGFNDWNAFGCDVNEKLIKETADFFVSSGLREAGYQYVNIDDCWSLKERGKDGKLVPDPEKFPSGIHGVADYVHGRGLKLGIYGDAGTKTCGGYPGSLGKEKLDAQTWADWGVDYVKYDNCYNQSDGSQADFVRRYTAMREAIDATSRPIVYSICEWGQSKPWEWAPKVGNLWRTTGDISDNWASVRSIVAENAPLAPYAGPGHWNDPDMLEIGNGGMSPTEYRAHMSLWAMMAAPLIIGTDLRKATADTLAILGNREIIALDQDPLGQQATVIYNREGRMLLSKPLSSGDIALAFYNSTDEQTGFGVLAKEAGLPEASAYRLDDLWTGQSTHAGRTLAPGVSAHGAVVYRVSPLADARSLPPALGVVATISTVIPSVPDGARLPVVVTNSGTTDANSVAFEVEAPRGWTVKLVDGNLVPRLGPDDTRSATFRVTAPKNAAAGSYPLTVKTTYTWGEKAAAAVVTTKLGAPLVVPPPDGVMHLSELPLVASSNAAGPVERDKANGEAPENDGSLITLAKIPYTRGLGTRAPSELEYYLGKRCSSLTTEVGIDDSVPSAGAASFKLIADDKVIAQSGVVRPGEPAKRLEANLKGVTWLKLVTGIADLAHPVAPTDWARPLLTCGKTGAKEPSDFTIFSFEGAGENIRLANAGAGGGFKPSAAFHTDGTSGLEVTGPADGNWFGRSFDKPLDLRQKTRLAFDVKTGAVGTVGEFAVEFGPDKKWCQGGHWGWVNPNSSKTVKTAFKDLHCPAGAIFDPSQVRGVWVFIKAATVVIDQVRAE